MKNKSNFIEEWIWKKLDDVAEIIMGQSPPGDTYNKVGQGMPFLQGKAEFGSFSPKHIKYTKKPLKKAPSGSVLISVRAPVGDVNIADINYCIGRGLASIKLKKGENTYLFYYLKKIKKRIEKMGTGSTFKAINKSILETLKIPLPFRNGEQDIEKQKQIVSILEKAEQLKGWRKEADKLTEDYLKSIFLEMFLKKDFEMKKLDEVCEKITDGTHKTPKYTSDGIPFLRVTDITESNTSKKFISKKEHEELIKRCNPKKGDILYTKNGTIGVAKTIDWNYEFSIFVSLCLIKPKIEIINNIYLEFFLNTDFAKRQATAHSKIATITNLHLIEIKKIKIPIPPIDLQNKFAKIVDKVEKMREYQKNSNQQIEDLFNNLMQKAFKGELVC